MNTINRATTKLRRRLAATVGVLVVVAILASASIAAASGAGAATEDLAEALVPEVLASTAHDTSAFTQGLVLDRGQLFESTGLRGESTLRELDPGSGDVLRSIDLDADLFGEGLAVVGDRLFQLTWTSGIAIAYDRDTFAEVERFAYQGEGWGLCHDGVQLVMSNGSPILTFRDPVTFAVISSIPVTLEGVPLIGLNELECVDGSVWANVFTTDLIVRIDPTTGSVTAVVDASEIAADHRGVRDDVLNGIAWNPEASTWLLTGKRWSTMYEVEFVAATPPTPSKAHQPVTKADCKQGGWENFANAGFRNQGDCIRFVQTGKFDCRDLLGCVSYDEEDPIRLATALVTSGGLGFQGTDELHGVETAVQVHGPVLGHAVELRNEDSMCSVEGGEAAAAAIVADPTITAVIGTTCLGAAVGAAPIISSSGLSMVSPSNVTPSLFDPDTRDAGYLRVAGNDRDQGAAMAEFAYGEGATTSAVIVDSFPYSNALAETFVETFEALQGNNLAIEAAAPDGSDAASVIAAIVAAGPPDVLFFPVSEPLGSRLVSEARATPALDSTLLAASFDLLLDGAFFAAVGPDAAGMAFSAIDLSYQSTPEYAALRNAYFVRFGIPTWFFHAMAADATNIVLNAVEDVGVVDGAGTLHIGRQALREALFSTTGFDGVTGTITCNPQGDCGAHGYEVIVPIP